MYSNPELSRPASNRVRSEFEIRAGKLFMFAFLQLHKYRMSNRMRSEFDIRAGKLFMFAFLRLNKYKMSFRTSEKKKSLKKKRQENNAN